VVVTHLPTPGPPKVYQGFTILWLLLGVVGVIMVAWLVWSVLYVFIL